MDYLQENWLEIVLALHVVALAVVNITPTPKDNEALTFLYKWIEKAAGVVTTKAKDK